MFYASDSRTLQTLPFTTEAEAQAWCDNINADHGLFYSKGEWYGPNGQPTGECPAYVLTEEQYAEAAE